MSARLMVQRPFTQRGVTYTPGQELTELDLADWPTLTINNRLAGGFLTVDDPSGEHVAGALPGAQLKVLRPFTANGREFWVGEVFPPDVTRPWPADSLHNRLSAGFLGWVASDERTSPKLLREQERAAVDPHAAKGVDKEALKAAKERARAERAAARAAAADAAG